MSDERRSALDRLVGAIGFTQMQVATTCTEGHDLTPPRPLLDALDEVRRYIAALEADRARLDFIEARVKESEYEQFGYNEAWTEHGDFGTILSSGPEAFWLRDDGRESGPTLRDAIDAAMSSSPLAPTQEGAT